MTSDCGCGEQMIQALCAAYSVMTTMFLRPMECNVLEP